MADRRVHISRIKSLARDLDTVAHRLERLGLLKVAAAVADARKSLLEELEGIR